MNHPRRMILSRRLPGIVLLGLVSLVLLLGVEASDPAVVMRQYVESLAEFMFRLPAGSHTLALPLEPVDATDARGIFGRSLDGIETLESWDPADKTWHAIFPGRPQGLRGDRGLRSSIIRVSSREAFELWMTGAVRETAWDQRVPGEAARSSYFGIGSLEPVTLGDLWRALEAAGTFQRERDALLAWDPSRGDWTNLMGAVAATVIETGTALCNPKTLGSGDDGPAPTTTPMASISAGSTPASTFPTPSTGATLSTIPSPIPTHVFDPANWHQLQALITNYTSRTPAWASARDSDGEEVSFRAYSLGDCSVVAPPGWTLDRIRLKGASCTKADEGVATIQVPATLRTLTNLPDWVPVRIDFIDDPNNAGNRIPRFFELLGLRNFGIVDRSSAASRSTTLTILTGKPDDSKRAIKLYLDTKGRLFGTAWTSIENTDTVHGSSGVSVHPVSLYYDPPEYETTAGVTTIKEPGHALDLRLAIGNKAIAFRRWGLSGPKLELPSQTSGLVVPFQASSSSQPTAASPDFFATTDFWLEYSPKLGDTLAVSPSPDKAWQAYTLPVDRFESDDGRSIQRVRCPVSGAVSQHIFETAITIDDPETITYFSDGLARLAIRHQDHTIDVWGKDLTWRWSRRATDGTLVEWGISPQIRLTIPPTRGGSILTPRLQVEPIFSCHTLSNTGNFDTLWFIQPRLTKTVDIKALMTKLKSAMSGDPASNSSSSATSATADPGALADQLDDRSRNLVAKLGLDSLGVKVGGALVGRLPTSQGVLDAAFYMTGLIDVWAKPTDVIAATASLDKVIRDLRAGISFSSESGTSPLPAPIALSFRDLKKITPDGLVSGRIIKANFGYTLPEIIGGDSSRIAQGQVMVSHESRPQGPIVNQVHFAATEALSFAFPGVDTSSWMSGNAHGSSTGDGHLELQSLDVLLEARQDHGSSLISRRRRYSLTAYGGTTPQDETQADGSSSVDPDSNRGILLSIARTSQRTTDTAVVTGSAAQTTPQSSSWLQTVVDRVIPGPSVFGMAGSDSTGYIVDLQFQNMGNAWVRLEELRGALSRQVGGGSSGSLLVGVGMRVNDARDWPWAKGTLNLAFKDRRVAGGGGEVEDLMVSDNVTFSNVFLAVREEEGAGGAAVGGTSLADRLFFGGEMHCGPTMPAEVTQNFALGFEADLGSKSVSIFGQAPAGNALKKDLRLEGFSGTGTFSWKTPKSFQFIGTSVFTPDWIPSGETTQVTLDLHTDENDPTNWRGIYLGFALNNAVPHIDLGAGAGIDIPSLAAGRDFANKIWTYAGDGTATLPPTWVQIAKGAGFIIANEYAMHVSGQTGSGEVGSRLLIQVTGNPAIAGIQLTGDLGVKITQLAYKRNSPWGMANMGKIHTGAGDHDCSIDYDEATRTLSFSPLAEGAVVTIQIAAGSTLDVSSFVFKVQEKDGLGGATYTMSIEGNATLHTAGHAYSGTLDMTVGQDENVRLALSHLTEDDGTPSGDLAGATFALTGVSLGTETVSGSRTVSTSVEADFTFPPSWAAVGGQTVHGLLDLTSSGAFTFKVGLSPGERGGKPPLDLKVAGFPIEIDLHDLEVTRRAGKMGAGGTAELKFIRPLNTVMGESGDTPVSFLCDLLLTSDEKIRFSARLTSDKLAIPFDFGFLTGTMACKTVYVETGAEMPGFGIDLDLSVTKPKPPGASAFMLHFNMLMQGGQVNFKITSTPPMSVDAVVFDASLTELGYENLFPGFMGVSGTMYLKLGLDFLYSVEANIVNLLYITPNSLPPFGFPFFDEIKVAYAILGFKGAAGVSLPKPQIGPESIQFAVNLVKDMIKGFGPTDDWTPLRNYLTGPGGANLQQMFPGPGITRLELELPKLVKDVFPFLPWKDSKPATLIRVLKLVPHPLSLMDLVPAADFGNAVVDVLQTIKTIGKIFSEPRNIFEIIPQKYRNGSFKLSLAGSESMDGGFTLQPDQVEKKFATSTAIPAFFDYASLARWMESNNLHSIPDIVRSQDDPKTPDLPLTDSDFRFASDEGKNVSGHVKDTWINTRQFVTQMLDLMHAAIQPDRDFDADFALGTHLKKAIQDHGVPAEKDGMLIAPDDAFAARIFGSTGHFQVKNPATQQIIFEGSVPLHSVTTRTVPGGVIECVSTVVIDGGKLDSSVRAHATMGSIDTYDQWVQKKRVQWAQDDVGVANQRNQRRFSYSWEMHDADWDSCMRASGYRNGKERTDYVNDCVEIRKMQRRDAWDRQNQAQDARDDQARDQARQASITPELYHAYYQAQLAAQTIVDLGEVSRSTLFDIVGLKSTYGYDTGRVSGWIIYDLLHRPTMTEAIFTDYGTAKYQTPGKNFTCLYRGSILTDLRVALHTLDEFSDVIFGVDVSPYMLGLSFWSMFFNDPLLVNGIDRITSAEREVTVGFKDSDVAMTMVLEDLAYHLKPAGSMTLGTRTASLSGASDLEEFVIDDRVLKARPFDAVVKGETGASDSVTIDDLIIFDGSAAMAKIVTDCLSQRENLHETDIQKFESMGLSVHGDPLIVKSLKVDLQAGRVDATIRPGQLDIKRRSDGVTLLSFDATNSALMDQMEQGGPYGDADRYPSDAGTFVINLESGATASAGSEGSVTSSLMVTSIHDLHLALGTDTLYRTVKVQTPATIAGDWVESTPGKLQGSLPVAGGLVVRSTPDGTTVTDPTATVTGAGQVALTMTRSKVGGIGATVPWTNPENNQTKDRRVEFRFDQGKALTSFLFPTGHVDPGGFRVYCDLDLSIPVPGTGRKLIELKIQGANGSGKGLEMEIKFNGAFHAEGSATLSILEHGVETATFIIDSSDGLTISSQFHPGIGAVDVSGHADKNTGVSLAGHLRVIDGHGTGIDAAARVATSPNPLSIHGELKIANYTVCSADLSIGNGRVGCSWSLRSGSSGVDAGLAFIYGGGFGVSISGSVYTHCFLGTLSKSFNATLDAAGTYSWTLGILHLSVDVARMSFSVSVDKPRPKKIVKKILHFFGF